METVFSVDEHLILALHVGNLLLSERDGNPTISFQTYYSPLLVGNLLLSERDGNPARREAVRTRPSSSRKPTTL